MTGAFTNRPFPDAVAVSVCVGEETEQLIVPYQLWTKTTGTVAAALMGEREGRIPGKLSPHQLWPVSVSGYVFEDLAHITVSSFYWKK